MFRSIFVANILSIGPKTLRYVIRIAEGINMMMLVIIPNDISSSKSFLFSISIPLFTNIKIPNIEKVQMILRMQSMAVQNTTNQSFSPRVLLYGSRYRSLILGNWKQAREMFVYKVQSIILLDFYVWLVFMLDYLAQQINDLFILWQKIK
jgi:hypothetical protein